jgi:hypothetical protein
MRGQSAPGRDRESAIEHLPGNESETTSRHASDERTGCGKVS